jgi:diguanylate cyclase (GGDEF)-like protein
MSQILYVEDSRTVGSLISKSLRDSLDFELHWAQTYAEALEKLDAPDADYFIGLLDLNLPDAPNGEVVELVQQHQIPAVVFSGDDHRESMWAKNVADYVLKEGRHNIAYLTTLINRIYRNSDLKILVVDDSRTSRRYVGNLLRMHRYQVLEARDGREALTVMVENPDIRMLITDYEMPGMDGFELIKELRNSYSVDDLAIIGMSGAGRGDLSARFIKQGANDFLTKPFAVEEFYCRVSQNITLLEHIQAIKDLSNKDYLTGLYNRRYFYDACGHLFESAKRKHLSVAVAMMDIDFFKKVNDTYGHDAGDVVLKQVSAILNDRFRESDIVARFGGEEFCVLTSNMAQDSIEDVFEDVRAQIESTDIIVGDETINVTISIGICTVFQDSLEGMITRADNLLYEAKEGGRNRIVSG